MAELFLAQEPPKPDLVVIKRILPYLSEEPEFVQMVLDEARIAAQLHHPNVVQVFELGRIDESIFIAMEFVEGVDLRRIVAEEAKFSATVPYAVASRICAQVAAGLDHAHNSKGVDGRPLGLIHRDVSPQNVMVAYSGAVKLVDFGIAKAEALAERSKPGVIKGKFLYLSPEAVMQERLDHRADIFALGTMLYEITTGRAPFARPTTEAILYAIRFETPSPPHLIRDDYPQELSRIVMKCLAKDRNQRYQRASAVQADLEALLASGAMRQSDDVAEYIARLLGEEEERTMLHVPIPAARKGAAAAPQAATPAPASGGGLASRPARRSSAENLPLAGDPEDAEFATEMARPTDILARSSPSVIVGDEEEDEPTAIRTLPGRPSGPGVPAVPGRAAPRSATGESTVQDRAARASAPTPPRPFPARKPASSPSVAALDRRRAPPPVDLGEEEEEASQSVSLTPATVNSRPSMRGVSAFRDEDSVMEEDSHVDTHSDVADLLEPDPTQPTSSMRRRDADDDESTAGYGNTYTETNAPPPAPARRPSVLLVALVTLLLVGAAGAAWLFVLEPMLKPAQPATSEASLDAAPPGQEPPAEPTAGDPAAAEPPDTTGVAPPAATAPDTGSPAPAAAPGTATADTGTPPPPSPQGTAATDTPPSAEATGQGSGTPAAPPAAGMVAEQTGKAPESKSVTPPPAPTPPTKVSVRFKAPARTTLKVAGRTVKPNASLSLLPGTIRVDYRCPGYRAPKGFKEFEIPTNPSDPVVFRVDCRQKSRR
ncbi:serine/threonine-protein kinase [Archangium sp.]|uniref:serine/threonine-protein kinase n=1 Tax=Archangium sp. TaxID=1872627 RepID=UPI0039C8605B